MTIKLDQEEIEAILDSFRDHERLDICVHNNVIKQSYWKKYAPKWYKKLPDYAITDWLDIPDEPLFNFLRREGSYQVARRWLLVSVGDAFCIKFGRDKSGIFKPLIRFIVPKDVAITPYDSQQYLLRLGVRAGILEATYHHTESVAYFQKRITKHDFRKRVNKTVFKFST